MQKEKKKLEKIKINVPEMYTFANLLFGNSTLNYKI